MILLTGGTGFIGRALVPALIERGYPVSLLTRRPERVAVDSRVQLRRGDLLDPESLSGALDGVTTVVHMAAALPGGAVPPETIQRINVDGTAHLARAAARCGVAQFVHGSSAGVYGDGTTPGPRDESILPAPRTLYEQTKLEGERALRAELSTRSVSWLILRPAGVHGPGRLASARFYKRVRDKRLWIHGPSSVIVHPTYIADVVSAVLLALGRTDLRAEIVNIAGPRALTYIDLIDLIAYRLGVSARQIQVPRRLTRAVATACLRLAREFGHRPQAIERLTYQVINRSVDIAKAQRLLGFAPSPLEAGIDATIDWARRERLL